MVRDEILQRALEGLEEDLDELGEGLWGMLERYEEGEWRGQVEQLPAWLALRYEELWGLCRFAPESVAPEGALGPRAVAVAAGWLEQLIVRWLGQSGVVKAHSFDDPQQVEAYRQHVRKLDAQLDALQLEAERTAQHARRTLAQWRDDVLAELEAQRVRDIDAIELLVAEGQLEPGRDARKEIAWLWEEQRRNASALLRTWEPFEGLLTRGLAYTRDGVEEIQLMAERVRQALEGAFVALHDGYIGQTLPPVSQEPMVSFEDPAEAAPLRTPTPKELLILPEEPLNEPGMELDFNPSDNDFNPYGELSEPEEDEDEAAEPELDLPFVLDEDFCAPPSRKSAPTPRSLPTRATREILADPEDELVAGPMIDFDDASTAAGHAANLFLLPSEPAPAPVPQPAASTPSAPSAPRPQLTLPRAKPPASAPTPPVERLAQELLTPRPAPAPTMEVVEDMETLLSIPREELEADAQRAATREEGLIEAVELPTAPLLAPPRQAPARDPDEAALALGAQEEETLDLARDDDAPHPDAPPAHAAAADEGEVEVAVMARRPPRAAWHGVATRRRRVWRALPGASFAKVWLAPLGLALALLLVAGLSQLGPQLPNPLLSTGGRLTLFAALSWLVIGPLALGWRASWRGWKPTVVREVIIEEEADVAIDAQGVTLGEQHVPWEGMHEVTLARSEASDTLMTLHHDTGPWHLLAAEPQRWAPQGLPLERAPAARWSIEGDALAMIWTAAARRPD